MRNRRATCFWMRLDASGRERTRSISFASMRLCRSGAAVGLFLLAFSAGCSNPLGRQYEYEEQIYLSVDGSATVVVDSSIPAFVALRGATFDPSMKTGVNRDQVRAWFESAGCHDVRVGQPWVRRGRRFVQVRMAVEDIRELGSCGALGWSRYQFERDQEAIHFVQEVGPAAGGNAGGVNWDGRELVGFKLHAPSPIFFHNVRRLEDGSPGDPDRGNILTWEQTLADRRAGQPLRMEVRMGSESILFRTLSLFAMAFAAAVAALAGIIWVTIRRARRRNIGSM
jgi:hypothetical protein